MTREEAIDVLKHNYPSACFTDLCEAVEIAIQALSAQPDIIRCKECRHRIVNDHYGEKGYLKIKGYCELDTGDPFELSRDAGNDDWFCADAERGEDHDERE